MATRHQPRWLDIQRRKKILKDTDGNVVGERLLPHWYGRMKVNGKWKWFKLYTDKRASQKRWEEVVSQYEQKDAGVITSQMEAARKPLSEHVMEYLDGLKRVVSEDHHRIVRAMLQRFIGMAGWKALADINEHSASRVLNELQAKGKTVAYTNQYLARVKAFINWCVPDRLLLNPLAKLKRANLKKALKRRARRPLAEHELSKLLNTCPPSRKLKYAFPAFIGLRRSELADVRWGDLHLDSIIPFLQLRPEQTKTGEATALPLHPYLVAELQKLTPGMPEANLFASLPEGRTLLNDLTDAGLKQSDASGRRADFHGLRHTFAKRLDESGCSHATRRALMRHSAGDQTDGYTLARLSEMYEAVKRLPWPGQPEVLAQAKTGTNDLPLIPPQAKSPVVTGWTRKGPALAASDAGRSGDLEAGKMRIVQENQGDCADRHASASSDLNANENRDSVAKTSPRSSVG